MIVIDSDNYAEAGIETLFFPGGEPHAKIPRYRRPVLAHLKLRTWSDVGLGACVLDALRVQGVEYKAFIPYFPGARQDKTDGTAPLTVKLMKNLLAYSNPVWVFDPHSIATRASIDCHVFMPSDLGFPEDDTIAGVIAPDEGAAWRATNFGKKVCPDAIFVQCTK